MSYFRTTSSGNLTRTSDGTLHALVERSGGGFDYYRYDSGNTHWSGPYASAGSAGNVHDPVVFTHAEGRLEALYREVPENRPLPSSRTLAGRMVHTYNDSLHEPTSYFWGRTRLAISGERFRGAAGVCRWDPANYGLDVLIGRDGGGLHHCWRNRNDEKFTPGPLLDASRTYAGCALTMGDGKELVGVAREVNGDLWLVHRGPNDVWKESKKIASGVQSNPALVQSDRSGIQYDLIVGDAAGRLRHFIILSDFTMHHVRTFGVEHRVYRQVGLVLTGANHLEVVAQAEGFGLEHFRFDGNQWTEGHPIRPAIQEGSWLVEHDTKVIGIHASLLHTGDVLFAGMDDTDEYCGRAALLHVGTGAVHPMDEVPHVFCGGHTQLPNGDLLVAGGHRHYEHELHVLQSNGPTWSWKEMPHLHGGRWYPTCTTLPDGKVLIIAGTKTAGSKDGNDRNNSYEIFDPAHPNAARTAVDLSKKLNGEWFCTDRSYVDMYPFVFVLPHGKVLVHSRNTSRFWSYDPKTGDGAWSERYRASPAVRTYPQQGAAVLLPLVANENGDYGACEVMTFGGAATETDIDAPALGTCEKLIVDGNGGAVWRWGPSLLKPRVMPDAVLLPDGNVLVMNGSRTGSGEGHKSRQPELDVELYDPAAGTFRAVAPMHTPRLYHAAAILLPDARVLVSGKCQVFNAKPYDYPEHRGEVYTPPYLLNGSPRPRIRSAAEPLSADAWFNIEVENVRPDDIGRVVLMHPSATTHSFDMAQRAVELRTRLQNGTLQARSPKTNWVVPPGWYMLFIVSRAVPGKPPRGGVPSIAKWLKVPVFS